MARILVVNDDESVRAAIGKLLAEAGNEVVEAKDWQVALRTFGSEKTS